MFKKRCYNGGTKHKFRPRYSDKERQNLEKIKVISADAEEFRKFLTLSVYECDICVWCGKKVSKENMIEDLSHTIYINDGMEE